MSKPSQQDSNLPIELAAPARRALIAAGYTRLDQIARASEAEIGQLHSIGPNALQQLRRTLAANGLSFADKS